MSQQAQAQNFQDRAQNAILLGRQKAEELAAKVEKGDLSPEQYEAELENTRKFIREAQDLCGIASDLATITPPNEVWDRHERDVESYHRDQAANELDTALSAADTPAFRRPMGAHPSGSLPAGATTQQAALEAAQRFNYLSSVQTGDAFNLHHLSAPERTALARVTGIPQQNLRFLQGKERAYMDRYLRGPHIPEAQRLKESQLQQLAGRGASSELSQGTQGVSGYIDRSGGFARAAEIRTEVLNYVRDERFIRRFARVFPTNAPEVAFPSMKIKISMDAQIPGRTQVETVTIRDFLGKTSFTPYGKQKIVKVARQFIQDLNVDVISMVSEQIAEQAYDDEETLFLYGDGANKPYGVVTALKKAGTQAVPHTGTAATADFTRDDVRTLHNSLPTKWQPRGVYMTNREHNARVLTFRTEDNGSPSAGGYVFNLPMTAGDRTVLEGRPYIISDHWQTAAAVGDAIILYGDWAQFWIVEHTSMDLMVLGELYAETDEIGYKYSRRLDAAPVRIEPWIYLSHT